MTKRHRTYEEVSRKDWGKDHDDTKNLGNTFNSDDIRTGCLQRIANAVEKIAENYGQLIAERDDYQRRYNNAVSRETHLERQLAATRGHLTRLKRKSA